MKTESPEQKCAYDGLTLDDDALTSEFYPDAVFCDEVCRARFDAEVNDEPYYLEDLPLYQDIEPYDLAGDR